MCADLALISGVACVGILHVGDELREINGLRITPRIPIEQLQRILREACGSVSMKIVPIPNPSPPMPIPSGSGACAGPDADGGGGGQHSWGLAARRLSGGGGAGASSSQAQSIESLSVHSALVRQQSHASAGAGAGVSVSVSLGNRSLSQSVRTLCESAPTFLRALFSYDPLIDDHIPCKQADLKFDVGSILKVSRVELVLPLFVTNTFLDCIDEYSTAVPTCANSYATWYSSIR